MLLITENIINVKLFLSNNKASVLYLPMTEEVEIKLFNQAMFRNVNKKNLFMYKHSKHAENM